VDLLALVQAVALSLRNALRHVRMVTLVSVERIANVALLASARVVDPLNLPVHVHVATIAAVEQTANVDRLASRPVVKKQRQIARVGRSVVVEHSASVDQAARQCATCEC